MIAADGLALDEANLTGESEPVLRGAREPVWSGSFAVEGAALFEVDAVGADSRAARLAATARAFRHPRSPLERATDRLLLWIIAFSAPLTIGLTISVLIRVDSAAARVQAVTAGIVNLVPEGLILLISVTAAASPRSRWPGAACSRSNSTRSSHSHLSTSSARTRQVR